jgi:hypothetical protein
VVRVKPLQLRKKNYSYDKAGMAAAKKAAKKTGKKMTMAGKKTKK